MKKKTAIIISLILVICMLTACGSKPAAPSGGSGSENTKTEELSDLEKNIPGVYQQQFEEELEGKKQTVVYEIVLNKDHTGQISIQDDIDVIWDRDIIQTPDGSTKYDYYVAGDYLYINIAGAWGEFKRAEQ